MRRYDTFEAVNHDLKLLKIQSQIDTEELKLCLNETKESLSPGNLVTGLLGGFATSAVIFKLLNPLIGFGISRLIKKFTK
ncbi:hypothetical protein ATE92_1082 [Ulvibacter sp. MAR_2010_11]|uniref:DUF6327 family protein n=1 Tax=Ulvibacter sp. MAR_2010_11 TaxID=1250229 RepID=UPI000C2C6025|nr:DUF6327 family protein [Ulvibacter sp. MAR_2010_11]PKA82940.1 hypothetical protein ATE92_1082 [Ulvibacter sp. MAR_2010_11]